MKKTLLGIGVLLLASFGFGAEVRTGGYLSFAFLKGQEASGASQGSFQDLRAGAFASGDLGQGFSFLVEARFRSESKFELEQALAGFRLGASGDLRLGLFLVPFGKYNESNRPQQTVLVRTPLNVEAAYPESWRDIGLTTQGRAGFLRYTAYFANGLGEKDGAAAGQSFRDVNKDKAKGGRLGFIVGEGFEVGASYYSGKYDRDNALSLTLEGADLTWVTKDYEVRGEYTRGLWKNPGGMPDGKADGFFGLVVLYLGKLHPVASFQRWDPGDAGAGLRLVALEGGAETLVVRSRWALGARYYVSPTFVVKAEYDINREKGLALKNNLVLVQAAVSF
ncbi:MAG TPA: hypothetical protein VHP61_06845 [Acidobacteriota bacterium]|nr:hypothetical protein [Acidobacteriota bacterium]